MEQSLKKLLLKKPLNKVTINDITRDCGISRMTFYYHFRDIYDLVRWICLEDARSALERGGSAGSWQQDLLQIFETVRENKPFVMNVYRCVHQEQLEQYLAPQVDRLLMDVIRKEIGSLPVSVEDQKFIARTYSHILIGVMMDWIKEDMRGDPRQIVDRLSVLMSGSIASALNRFQS